MWGIHKRLVAADRLDLNNPHTAVWGIHKRSLAAGRLDLNNSHTAVWGILSVCSRPKRLDLNHPPTPVTPVGGISEFSHSLYIEERSHTIQRIDKISQAGGTALPPDESSTKRNQLWLTSEDRCKLPELWIPLNHKPHVPNLNLTI